MPKGEHDLSFHNKDSGTGNISFSKECLVSLSKLIYRANKTLGQNFLVNQGVIAKIISVASLSGADTVLEIGPGTGLLTFELARHAKKVVAVEKDKTLAQMLREKIAEDGIGNIEVITDDILKFLSESRKLKAESYTVVANIPYYLTSALIRILLELPHAPDNIILTIQKEVARRIAATDGKESILSLSVKFYADAKILFYISKGSFFPIPKVDSACIEITPRKTRQKTDSEAFFAVVKAGFSAPRKKLLGNLAHKLEIEKNIIESVFLKAGVSADARAETLTFAQWVNLVALLREK